MKFWQPTVTMLLMGTLVVLGVLSFQNRDLREELSTIRFERRLPQADDLVPSHEMILVDGGNVRIGKTRRYRHQVLLVLNRTCPYCEASLPEWDRLSRLVRERTDSVLIVGISLDSADAARMYAHQHDLGFPLVTAASERWNGEYRIPGVPITVVLNRDGRIVYVHGGVFTRVEAESILTIVDSQRWR